MPSIRKMITIPAELNDRMNSIGAHLNWSGIAASAYESKLAEVIAERGARDVADAVARLRASKAKGLDLVIRQGRQAGRRWAMDVAEAAALERLSIEFEEGGLLASDEDSGEQETDHSICDEYVRAYQIISGAGAGDAGLVQDARRFWGEILGEGFDPLATNNVVFARSFIDSASDFWCEVSHKV